MAISRYRSYLMRVWISTGADGPHWAGRVECIQDGMQPRRFNDPEALLSYLRLTLLKDAAPPAENDITSRTDRPAPPTPEASSTPGQADLNPLVNQAHTQRKGRQ